jgi:hypothetical protein
MRRILPILLVALALVPAGLAATSAAGDGTFAVRAGSGTVVVTGRGTIFGQIDAGRLVVTDPSPGDDIQAQVSGATRTYLVSDSVTVYAGKDIRFRFVGGRYAFSIKKAVGIAVSAVGKGSATITGNPDVLDPGDYAVNGAKWRQLPLLSTTLAFGSAS